MEARFLIKVQDDALNTFHPCMLNWLKNCIMIRHERTQVRTSIFNGNYIVLSNRRAGVSLKGPNSGFGIRNIIVSETYEENLCYNMLSNINVNLCCYV